MHRKVPISLQTRIPPQRLYGVNLPTRIKTVYAITLNRGGIVEKVSTLPTRIRMAFVITGENTEEEKDPEPAREGDADRVTSIAMARGTAVVTDPVTEKEAGEGKGGLYQALPLFHTP